MKRRKVRHWCIAAGLAAMIAAAVLPKVYAAYAIDTDRTDCSIMIDMQDSGNVELRTLPITVNFYKIAEVSAAGKFTVVQPLKAVDAALDFAEFNSDERTEATKPITNEYWAAKSAAAKQAVDKAVKAGTFTAAATVTTGANGKGQAENLTPGLYLVDAQTVRSAEYVYTFNPYLISMPNNLYGTQEGAEDAWLYEYTIGLKGERSNRTGDLRIEKNLDVYNESLGKAVFVFQVEASKVDVDSNKTEIVYSNVESLEFDKPGKQSIVIQGLPAGSHVVVTEIYTGASYKLESDETLSVDIVANDGDDKADGADDAQTVEFKNTYDDRLNGGYGVVNTYSYDSESGTWSNNQNPEWSYTPQDKAENN